MRCTGHVGPIRTTPATPVPPTASGGDGTGGGGDTMAVDVGSGLGVSLAAGAAVDVAMTVGGKLVVAVAVGEATGVALAGGSVAAGEFEPPQAATSRTRSKTAYAFTTTPDATTQPLVPEALPRPHDLRFVDIPRVRT